MHDVVVSVEFVSDELAQQRESGHDVAAAERALAATDPDDIAALEAVHELLTSAPLLEGWSYEEPGALGDILDTLPVTHERTADEATLEDKIRGGWLGRIAGCNVGKPIEWGTHWTSERIRRYLDLAGAYPLRDYIPVLDPMPEEFELRDCWVDTTLGNVDGSARDDDIDYPILGLHLLERYGSALCPELVGQSWLMLLPFHQVYTAERAAYANLVAGVPVPQTARRRNPYREWIGALIRGDIFGWVHPASPREAIALAYQDASLSHTANGIYGELWAAALVSSAFTAASAAEALEASLEHVPPRSRLAEALRDVQAMHADGRSWEEALAGIQERYGHYSWVHTINNAALIAAGLLWGDGDVAATIGLTVQGGWDTDSNGATAGSVAGVLAGASGLPAHLVDPLHDRTRSALFGFDNSRISDLADRTIALARSGLR